MSGSVRPLDSVCVRTWSLSTDAATDAKSSAPLVASDSSSSGGSDSEEDDKTTSGPPNTIATCVPGNKPDDLKRRVDPQSPVNRSTLQEHVKLLQHLYLTHNYHVDFNDRLDEIFSAFVSPELFLHRLSCERNILPPLLGQFLFYH